jgi:hypothetical protein
MRTYKFTFEVVTTDEVDAATALKWLHRTLEQVDKELPDSIQSVQTLPTFQVEEN